MNKTVRKIITSLMILTLLTSLFSVAALAASSTYKMVAFGDATAQGYMFNDYNTSSTTGYGASSSYSTANRMKNYLKKQNTSSNVELYDFTFKTLRYNEINALLNPSDPEKDAECVTNISSYASALGLTQQQLSNAVISAVTDADLITFDVGMGQLTSFIVNSFASVDVGSPYSTLLNDLLGTVDPKTSALLTTMRNTLKSFFTSISGSGIDEETLDGILYFYGSYIDNFEKVMNIIYSINSDATVIVMGMYNPLEGISLTYGGVNIDVEGIAKTLISAVDVYITTINEHRTQYKYANLSDGCEIFADEIASGDFSDESISLVAKSLYTLNPVTFNAILYEDICSKYTIAGWISATAVLSPIYLTIAINDKMVADAYTYNDSNTSLKTAYSYIRYAFDIIMDAMCNATSIKSVDSAMLTYDVGNMFLALQHFNGTNVSDADRIALHTYIRFQGYGNFGMYPSPNGMDEKFAAMKNAYESKFTADGALLQNLAGKFSFLTPEVTTSISNFISRFVESAKNVIANVTTTIKNLIATLGQNVNTPIA